MTLSEEWLTAPCSQGGTWEPLSPNGSGLVFLCPGLDWRLRPGEAKDRVQAPVDRGPGLGQAPEHWAEAAGLLGLGTIL
jgi:hypothetical protein